MQTQKRVAVFGSFLTNAHSGEFAMAEELGYLLAGKGFQVVCGGHGGIANPLVAGVRRGGGSVLGVSLAATRYPGRTARMSPLVSERVEVGSIPERLELFAQADGFVFFTGGIGTFSEFAFIWHSLQLAADFDRPMVLLSRGWRNVLAQLRKELMAKHRYYRLVHLCDRARDAVAVVSGDYALKYDDPEQTLCKEAVLFEFDGTLVESPVEGFITSCESLGYFFQAPEASAAFRAAGGCSGPDGDGRRFQLAVLEYLGMERGRAVEVAEQLGMRGGEAPRLCPDAPETLRHFREHGFFAGVVSARPPAQVREILAVHGLSGWIDLVLPRSQSCGSLPLSALSELLAAAGCGKDGLVYVGIDPPEEALFPSAFAIDSILLDRDLARIANDKAFTIRSLRELKHVVIPGSRSRPFPAGRA